MAIENSAAGRGSGYELDRGSSKSSCVVGHPFLRARLSLFMFLLYAVPGAWYPLISLRLVQLGSTPFDIGWAFAAHSCAAVLAPLVAGQVADRWVSAERCVSFCALV